MVAIFTGLVGAGFERGSGAALGGVGLLGSAALGRAGEGVFLNAATGNLLINRQDEFLVGRGPDVAFAHTYNSQGALDDANDDDWRQSTDRRLISLTGALNTNGGAITRVGADGSEITYTYNSWSDGSYYRATDGAGAHDKLTNASGVWTWEEGSSHITETYAAAETGVWRIATARDVDGNTLTFSYVSGDPTRLDKVTTADGGYIQYTWTGVNITKIETYYSDLAPTPTIQKLTRVHYGYDGQNRLTSVTVDLSPTDNATSDSKVYTLTYTYDSTSNRIASITQSDGSALAISYVNVSGVYKVSRLAQTVVTGETRTTDILYSTATIGAETFDVAEVRVYRDATLTGYLSTTLKSIAGQLREVVQAPAVSGQSAQTFTYSYDGTGNVTSIAHATAERTQLTEYVYDAFGNATQITVKLNGSSTADTTTTRTFVDNNLVQETVSGSTAAAANANLTTRYVYDGENHLRFTITAEGRVSEFEYETTGELKRTIAYKAGLYTAGPYDETSLDSWGDANAANAEVKTYEYDARGGLLRAYAFSATASFVESTADGRSQINSVYDQSGALLSRWVEGQASETFIYDGLGRMIASTDLSGGLTHFHFVDDGSGAQTIVTTRAAFNSGANDWDATAESLIATQTFNRAGELVTSSESVISGAATTTVGTKTYAYDKLGRLRSVTDATGRKSYFLYDDLGRRTADVGHDGQLSEYRYDATGRLIESIHYATAISTTTIASAATAVVIADVRPSYSTSDIVQWTIYDANDRVVQTIQGDGAVTAYEYDKLGRLIATKGYYNRVSVTGFSATPPTSPVSVSAHAKDFIVRSFYDGDGNLVGALNGEGYLTEYVYDGAGRKIRDIGYANPTNTSDRASGTFNTLKTSLANASADRTQRYVYDGQGFLRFTIDALGEVTEARYWDGPSSSPTLAARQQATGLVRETLVYNVALGALGAYDYTTVKAAVAALTGVTPRVSRFVYNDKAQLVYAIDAVGGVTRNWYDASGRITKSASYSTLYTTSFSADASTWKATLDAWSPSGDQTRITRYYYTVRNEVAFVIDAEGYVTLFGYDAEGRVTSESRYSTKLTTVDDTWTWSSVNGASKGAPRTVTSSYDTLGRLLIRTDAAGRFEYFSYYNNGALAQKIEGTWADNARTSYYYDQAGKTTQEMRGASLASILGSVGSTASQITTSTGALHSPNGQYRAVLNAFGELIVYHNGEAIWRTGVAETVTGATYRLVAETNRLVIYRDVTGQSSVVIWQAAASSSGATFMAISDTGVLSLNKGAAPTSTEVVWSTPSAVAQNPYSAYWLTTSFAYDGMGNVIQSTAPNGQVTTMTYDKAGRLVSRSAVVGSQTIAQSFVYNAFDSVKAIDALGNASYSYFDKLGRLEWSVDVEGYVNQTTYNSFGETASNVRYRERAANWTTTLGTTTLPVLASGDTGLVTAFVYDNLGRVAYVIDAESYVTGTTYNAFGQTLSVTRYDNTTATLGPPTNTAGAATEFQYDLLGRLTRNEDALDVAELYAYDAYERTSITNRIGGVTTNTYDGSGLLVQESIAVGGGVTIVNKYEYDARGQLTKKLEGWNGTSALRTTRYEYDKLDRLVAIYHDARAAVTSADGAASTITPTERFYYDKNGNLAGQIDAAGAQTFYWYDGVGRLTHKLAPNGAVTINTYDANGRIIESKMFATAMTPPASVTSTPPAPTANAALDRVTQYVYDKLGRTREVKTLNVRAAAHNGSALAVDSSPQTVSTIYDYDANANVVRTTDANGAQAHAYFDKLGRKVAEIDAAGYRTSWSYDANGNVASETRYATQGSVPSSITAAAPAAPSANTAADRVTNFTYDKMGRRLTETRLLVKVQSTSTPGAHADQSAIITYTYNALGLVLTKTEASGDTIAYGYDSGGRLTSEQRSGYVDFEGATVTPRVEYAYNALNDVSLTRQLGKTSGGDRTTTYTYGAGGLLAAKTDAAGFKRTYIYDAAGRVRREEYDRADFTGALNPTEAAGYDYDAEGRLTQQGALVRPSGSTTTWTRSKVAAGLETIDTATIHYNAFGDISERGINNVFAETFDYDAAGRLLRSNAGDGVWKYFMYDKAGNQTLTIAALGKDFTAAAYDTLSEVLGLWTGGTATIATANVADVVATITRYDARNQAIAVLEPKRQRNATTSDDLSSTRAYTAFGDVAYEINAAGARIDYTYNTMGRLIRIESPAVEGRVENGKWITGYNSSTGALEATSSSATTFRPVEQRYYDAAGRLVAARDANGNLTRYTLLAGTGYGGSEALIAETIAADGGVTRVKYDIHGDARRIEDALYNGAVSTIAHATVQTFDMMGRLASMNRSNILTDYYAYDGLGQRTKHWNSFYNSGGAPTNNVELTAYDHQGRIIQTIAAGGDATAYAYGWSGSLATTGMGTFGGWSKITTYANGKTLIEKSDVFGHDVQRTNMGGYVTSYSYDKAGRLTQRGATLSGAAAGETLYQSYYNTGRLKEIWQTTGGQTRVAGAVNSGEEIFDYRGAAYGYDKTGNVVSHVMTISGAFQGEGHFDAEHEWVVPEPVAFTRLVSSQSATFDALGRIVTWSEAGNTAATAGGDDKLGPASHVFEYDAAGNIRRSLATYRALDAQGNFATTNTTQDYWYRYDAMNRMVTSKGSFSGSIGTGSIVRGTTGIDTFYNLDGTRAYTLNNVSGARREDYVYDALGRVTTVKSGTNQSSAGAVTGAFVYDALSRLTSQIDYVGGSAKYSRTATYNDKNQLLSDDVSIHKSNDVYRTLSTYDYGTGANYALGAVLQIDAQNWKSGAAWPTMRTVNAYVWRDGAVLGAVTYTPNMATPGVVNLSSYSYDIIGGQAQLTRVDIADGHPRFVVFRSDMLGQVIRRDEKDGSPSIGDPHEVWLRYSGRQMGYVGNNGSADVDYASSIAQKQAGVTPSSFADFDLAYDHINAYTQGSNGGVYTIQSGDTLQSIAANLWGDASLWYKIAEVNGISAETALTEGAMLIISVGVQNNHNNATTFQPYDPLEVLGNLNPTAPKPNNGRNCGTVGQVLLAVIAIAIVAHFGPTAMKFFANLFAGGGPSGVIAAKQAVALAEGTIALADVAGTATAGAAFGGVAAGGAAAGAVASAATQAVGVATGIQEKFSWNAVAMAAIGGGVGGAVGLGMHGAAAWQQAMVASAITQGIGVATGLQDKFSWAGVAAAGIGAYAGNEIGQTLPPGMSGQSAEFAMRGASALVNAATRSLIDGSDFGDNMLEALPDLVAQMTASGMSARPRATAPAPSAGEDNALAMRSLMHGDHGPHFQGADGGFDLLSFMRPRGVKGVTTVLDDIVVTGPKPLKFNWYDSIDPLPPGRMIGTSAGAPGFGRLDARYGYVLAPAARQMLSSGGGTARPPLAPASVGPTLATGTVVVLMTTEAALGTYAAVNHASGLYEWGMGGQGRAGPDGTAIIVSPFGGAHEVQLFGPSGGGGQNSLGFGVVVRSREEASLLADMQLQGADANDINGALARLRANNGASRTPTTDELRGWPGVAYVSGDPLPPIDGPWLFGGEGAIPGQVADRLAGRRFESIRQFRAEVWRAVADVPELAAQFDVANQALMRGGNAPFARQVDRYGGQEVFQIHHPHELRFGGSVYDMSNMLVVTPRRHNEIHYGGNE